MFSVGYSWNSVRMFALMKSWTLLKMDHVGSKTMSLGQIFEKPWVVYALQATFSVQGHIFSMILVKLGQNVCLYEISDEFQNGLFRIKNRMAMSNLRKTFVHTLNATFSILYTWNLARMFAWMKSWTSLIMGHLGLKNRSPGQILEKSCVHSSGHIFSLIFMKLGRNFCFDEVSYEFEKGSCRVNK